LKDYAQALKAMDEPILEYINLVVNKKVVNFEKGEEEEDVDQMKVKKG